MDAIEQPVMYAEKSWGSYTVIDVQPESYTIKVNLKPGHQMKYHSHYYRDEVWTVVSGRGRVVIDGASRRVKAGDVVTLPAESKHTVIAETDLHIIEVQLGQDITVDDKTVYTME